MLFQKKYRVESTRLKNWDYSANGYYGIYYITICTKNREWLLGNIVGEKMQLSAIGEIVLQGWNDSFVMRAELFCDHAQSYTRNHYHRKTRSSCGQRRDARPCVSTSKP